MTVATAAIVPLGSVASARASGPLGDTPAPGSLRQAGQPTPTPPPPPTTNPPGNRFSPQPAASPQPAPANKPGAGAPAEPVTQANARWLQNHRATELWSGPDEQSISFGWVASRSYFAMLAPQDGPRIRVQNPLTKGVAYITAADVGPSGAPPEWYVARNGIESTPARIVGGANIRSAPSVEDGNVVGKVVHNEGISVIGEVKGSDGELWYKIGDNQVVHGSLVRMPTRYAVLPGKLIVAELTDPCIVTAYEDGHWIYSSLSLKGTTAWQTPTGVFTIVRRVANEIMSSEGLGIPRDAPGGYYVKDVLFTQYFTNDGASIHYNWWSSNWGYSGSHGCLGMNYDDALWFWQWAEIGTPLVIE
jgi:hypothetical protein